MSHDFARCQFGTIGWRVHSWVVYLLLGKTGCSKWNALVTAPENFTLTFAHFISMTFSLKIRNYRASLDWLVKISKWKAHFPFGSSLIYMYHIYGILV